MTKVTIASLQTDLETIKAQMALAAGEAQMEKTKRFHVEQERDKALKDAKEARQETADARAETERYRGMIEMLERLGTIPKQRIVRDAYGSIIETE